MLPDSAVGHTDAVGCTVQLLAVNMTRVPGYGQRRGDAHANSQTAWMADTTSPAEQRDEGRHWQRPDHGGVRDRLAL